MKERHGLKAYCYRCNKLSTACWKLHVKVTLCSDCLKSLHAKAVICIVTFAVLVHEGAPWPESLFLQMQQAKHSLLEASCKGEPVLMLCGSAVSGCGPGCCYCCKCGELSAVYWKLHAKVTLCLACLKRSVLLRWLVLFATDCIIHLPQHEDRCQLPGQGAARSVCLP